MIAYVGREESGENDNRDSFGCMGVNSSSYGGPCCPGDHTERLVIQAVTAERTLPFPKSSIN